MSTIVVTTNPLPSHPLAKQAADYAYRVARLASEKAVANKAKPATYKLKDDPKSLEKHFQKRFQSLSQPKQKAAITRVMADVTAPSVLRTASLGKFAGVNLKKPIPVAEQAFQVFAPAGSVLPKAFAKPPTGPIGVYPNGGYTKLALRLHKVKCVDETDGFLGSEAGSDEIAIGASVVDENGDVSLATTINVGSFKKDGDVKSFASPKTMITFNLKEGGNVFPKTYHAIVALAEIDMGEFPNWLNTLVEKLREQVLTYLTTIVGGIFGGLPGAAVGAIVGAAVSYALGKLIDVLKGWWSDDVFPPVTLQVVIPSAKAKFPAPAGEKTNSVDLVSTTSGHGGVYQFTTDWLVSHPTGVLAPA